MTSTICLTGQEINFNSPQNAIEYAETLRKGEGFDIWTNDKLHVSHIHDFKNNKSQTTVYNEQGVPVGEAS